MPDGHKPGSVPIKKALIIYLGLLLPAGSSGFKRRRSGYSDSLLLAADRVYLWRTSPCATVGSYPTRFIVAFL